MPSAPPALHAGSGWVACHERGCGEVGHGAMPPVLHGMRGRPLMAVRYGHELLCLPGNAVMAPVERPQEPGMAEEETCEDNCSLTAEEQYDLALENVARAFFEFFVLGLADPLNA